MSSRQNPRDLPEAGMASPQAARHPSAQSEPVLHGNLEEIDVVGGTGRLDKSAREEMRMDTKIKPGVNLRIEVGSRVCTVVGPGSVQGGHGTGPATEALILRRKKPE